MIKIFLGLFLVTLTVCSCKEKNTNGIPGSSDTSLLAHVDEFFPRFSITKEEFEEMVKLYESPCRHPDEECEAKEINYLFDQPKAIEAVHGNKLERFKGRYDSAAMKRYIELRSLSDRDEGKVFGFTTVLYSIKSKHPTSMGKTFYYDLASICPPPYGTCVKDRGKP